MSQLELLQKEPKRTRSGRHSRSLAKLARDVRRDGRNPYTENLLAQTQALADVCDRLEANPDASEHTLIVALQQLRAAAADLREYASAPVRESDPLRDALSAALRDSAAS